MSNEPHAVADIAGEGARLAAGIVAGDRRLLAKTITLAESTRSDHQALAGAVMAELLPRTGNAL